jgi:hypothetical protein
VLYECPEAGWDKRIFCYPAKAHPALAANDDMLISYVANTFDFWQVGARLYWLRFFQVKAPIAPQRPSLTWPKFSRAMAERTGIVNRARDPENVDADEPGRRPAHEPCPDRLEGSGEAG